MPATTVTEIYENISAEEFENSIPLSYWERRQLLREQQDAAQHAFFSHDFDLGWKRLAYIPTQYRNEHLVCCWCRLEAVYYQMRPVKVVFCWTCANTLRRERRKLSQSNKRWKDGAESRRIAEISKRA